MTQNLRPEKIPIFSSHSRSIFFSLVRNLSSIVLSISRSGWKYEMKDSILSKIQKIHNFGDFPFFWRWNTNCGDLKCFCSSMFLQVDKLVALFSSAENKDILVMGPQISVPDFGAIITRIISTYPVHYGIRYTSNFDSTVASCHLLPSASKICV